MRIKGGRFVALSFLAIALALAGGEVRALTLADTNLVDLLSSSTSILRGTVTQISDGLDATTGLPYTEVTVDITERLRGSEEGAYTFRQFGLRNARLSADGTKKMMPAPEGFPRYEEGEEVLLFMAAPAGLTGLRSTYGLGNGKFSFGPGRIENQMANQGLFRNVSIKKTLKNSHDQRLLDTEIGAVNPDDFMSLIQRAVAGDWVAKGKMWRTNVGPQRDDKTRTPDPTTPQAPAGGPKPQPTIQD